MALTNLDYKALPKLSDIQGFWRLEEESGTRDDLSDNNNDLAEINTVTYDTGKIGNAAKFVVANDEVLYRLSGDCVGINNSTFTLLAWIKMATGSIRTIVGGSLGSSGNRQFRVETDGKLGLIKGGVAVVGYSSDSIGNDIWTHVGVSYDGTDYKFYINGSLSGSGSNAQTLINGDYYVGSNNDSIEDMDGLIDEHLNYDVLLTDNDVADIYAITSVDGYSSTFIPKIIIL